MMDQSIIVHTPDHSRNFKFLTIYALHSGTGKPAEEEEDLVNDSITTVFAEQPLAYQGMLIT